MSRRYHFGSIIDGLEIGGGRGILCESLWLVLYSATILHFIATSTKFSIVQIPECPWRSRNPLHSTRTGSGQSSLPQDSDADLAGFNI
ncbi:hypothetical protein T06_15829 [Trichinella sp. T6]|nr:hypothetical protein T06_15829 [Trichinella sp. T6]